MTDQPGPTIEGILRLTPSRWSGYARIGNKWVDHWFKDRVHSLPDGAYVRITVEVLDPHPKESEPQDEYAKLVAGEPRCERCKNRRTIWHHDPSADGHGGLNGGEWRDGRCPDCNPDGRYPQRDRAGNAIRFT